MDNSIPVLASTGAFSSSSATLHFCGAVSLRVLSKNLAYLFVVKQPVGRVQVLPSVAVLGYQQVATVNVKFLPPPTSQIAFSASPAYLSILGGNSIAISGDATLNIQAGSLTAAGSITFSAISSSDFVYNAQPVPALCLSIQGQWP